MHISNTHTQTQIYFKLTAQRIVLTLKHVSATNLGHLQGTSVP